MDSRLDETGTRSPTAPTTPFDRSGSAARTFAVMLLVTLLSALPRPPLAAFRYGPHTMSAAGAFDEASYEADRLSKDAEAMQAMKAEADSAFAELRSPWKWVIRKRLWDYMEENGIARFPRPVHHRIPNFDGADAAAVRLSTLPEFEAARCVKVNPDTPQRQVRHLVLE